MLDEFKGWRGFWRGVFSEESGTPSFSRVATGFLVAFAAGWISHLVWHNHSLPDLAGLALFCGTIYGLNRVSKAASDIGQK